MQDKKILIIEDSPSIRSMLDSLFAKAGYTVVAAGDGESGLTVAEQGGFSVILLDLMMPKINGIDFLKSVRGLMPQEPNGPIVVFTSQSDETIKQAALDAGAAKVISKGEDELLGLPKMIEAMLAPASN